MHETSRREVPVGLATLAAASQGFAVPTDPPASPPVPLGTDDVAALERIAGISFTEAERALIVRTAGDVRR